MGYVRHLRLAKCNESLERVRASQPVADQSWSFFCLVILDFVYVLFFCLVIQGFRTHCLNKSIMAFIGTWPSSDNESQEIKMREKPGKTEKEDTPPPTAAELQAFLEKREPRLNSFGTKYCRYKGKDY